MTIKFKNFEELGRAVQKERLQEETKAKDNIKNIIDERMDDLLPGYNVKSNLPGIDTISIIKNGQKGGLYIALYPDPNKMHHFGLSVFKDGSLSGKIPSGFKINYQDIYEEVWNVLNTIGLDFWYAEPQDILSVPDWPMPEKKEKVEPPRNVSEDRRRIEFFRNQPDALFGFTGKGGFSGYYGFLFSKFIVLEHPLCENAAYFIDLNRELTEQELADAKTFTGRNKLMEEFWKPYSGRGKWDVFTSGAERVAHKPINDWIPQMVEKLNKRTPVSDRAVKFESERKETS